MIPSRRVPRMTYSDLPLFSARECAAAQPDRFAQAVGVEDYDISERRSGAQGGSAKANARAAEGKQRDRELVYAEVLRSGRRGLTCAEYCEWAGMAGQLARVSGRFSELKALGLIVRVEGAGGTPVLRGGCGIWIDARLACARAEKGETA